MPLRGGRRRLQSLLRPPDPRSLQRRTAAGDAAEWKPLAPGEAVPWVPGRGWRLLISGQGVGNTFLDLLIGYVPVPSPFFDDVAQ